MPEICTLASTAQMDRQLHPPHAGVKAHQCVPQFKTTLRDPDLRMPTALVIHGDYLYVGSLDELRQYHLRTGELVQVAAKSKGLRINYLVMAFKCS